MCISCLFEQQTHWDAAVAVGEGGCLPRGVCAKGGGVSAQGVCPEGGVYPSMH